MERYVFSVTHEATPNNLNMILMENDYIETSRTIDYIVAIHNNTIEINNEACHNVAQGSEVWNYENIKYGLYNKHSKIKNMYYLYTLSGGRFVIYEDGLTELTLFGSKYYIQSSQLGVLKSIN